MQPPKCKLCGVAEWRHVCSGVEDIEEARRFSPPTPNASRASRGLPAFVTKPATKPVAHATPAVARNETVAYRNETVASREVPRSEPASRVKALEKIVKAQAAEIEALHGEVAQLKRRLAEAQGGTPQRVPMTATERSRKLREKLKAKKRRFGEQQFEG